MLFYQTFKTRFFFQNQSAKLTCKNFYFQNMLFELKYLIIRCTYMYLMDGF